MKIKIWGCRGSIATPGKDTIRYGGNTTCVELRSSDGKVFILDAGSGVRNLGKALRRDPTVSEVRFFITHAHWDHLAGFPFFEPIYDKDFRITFCNGAHAEGMIQKYLHGQLTAPYFPVDFHKLRAKFDFRCEFHKRKNNFCPLGRVQCHPFPLSHPNGGYGFKLMENGKTFVFLTDNELGFRHENGLSRTEYVGICRDADLLLHDAQYTSEEYRNTRGWGHSTYQDVLDLAIDANVKRLGLIHHDPDHTDDDLDQQADYCKKYLQQMNSRIECFLCAEGIVFDL
jgi:phosphoribosyl 1,2-cyclic phosphodiesterase